MPRKKTSLRVELEEALVGRLLFPAALAPAGSGRKSWTQDSDGEGILSLSVPAIAADALGGQLKHLRERSFVVILVLDESETVDA